MTQDDELKQIFHSGWTNPNVVSHRVERFIKGEFGFPLSRTAWLEVLRQSVPGEARRKIADMGTGPGTIAQLWAELGHEVTGVDFSATMISAGQAAAKERGLTVDFVEADVEAPPFPENTFDVISSRAVLFTLPHPGYAVARWTRLLKPGGSLVLIGENNPTDPEKLKRQYRPAPGWEPDEAYRRALDKLPFRSHTDEMVRVVMEAAGLRNIRSMPMQSVMDARSEHEKQDPEYGVLQGTPYVLTGQRIEDMEG
ncbi:class I SAM-dependent methyltransferase [Gimesia sp.]|uniref:class I SAM-dependent methyltransferase n=1 Tax=Gimesia sp. TaxID=2024833 RepID=UPI000C508DAC|nr:class I SAM-dependent methyltransferase [Gimesia sp.]MAX38948.1 phosphatidylethanolamine N-methyltransferase [Gimesia sp.]HAH45411.1 class I SAM-dependent methyltransferase [Planctomycetaceae bacterium]HBL45808.1 class I SAM-dependent methyltransferase [Planctomycetaceae bacterium]|tara:strand:+ start:567 stop:1328 length:762 start_codon:yes stop_codon:yes gene_type:complete